MSDARELILVRIKEILEELAGTDYADNVFRNRTMIPEKMRPAFVLFDGNEDEENPDQQTGRPSNKPTIMGMNPQINVVDSAEADEIGTKVNAWRKTIAKALATDPTLMSLAHNGSIRYVGLEQGLDQGKQVEVEAVLTFRVLYVFRPTEV